MSWFKVTQAVYYTEVYIQTLIIYSGFIRDSIFYCDKWGLPPQLVKGSDVDEIISYKESLHLRIRGMISIDLLLYPFYHGWMPQEDDVFFFKIPSTKKAIYNIDPTVVGTSDPNTVKSESPILADNLNMTQTNQEVH
ncbi:hypothetical protein PPL_00224 [Heterostelium album PN500]|uniref:Uncharacterized protein n=1 Tax=Heterostelium pallidum (strain ATCC 26659 / Pp 5 / PN500) TaxID=670386 RepID=D3AVV9_HETP5|nr:hypothetical protein PPL_00224 [Heterostelium album PN500]EFA86432.1 hypothetical protein PPL_00224 [Heterostelium album PN500]|eukprot:XP_020438537.1 hypothetical protein PPL_00224 [Heterostelium album PN500]